MDNPKTQQPEFREAERAAANKGGRPPLPKGERKDCPVKVYFDRRNYAKLCAVSKREGVPVSVIVYQLAVNGKHVARLSEDEAAVIRKLAGMANNLNQLTRLAHVHGVGYVERELRQALRQIDDIIIKTSE